MTPPSGFSIITPLHGPNASEQTPITTSTLISITPENTPLINRASNSNNPDRMINPAFDEPNYEVLESLRRERKRQRRNEDLCTKLEYFSEEYDKEREMEPMPMRVRETTPILRAIGHHPSTNIGGNIPPNDTHLLFNAQSFIPNNLQPSNRPIPVYVNPYPQPNMRAACGQPMSHPFQAHGAAPPLEDLPPITRIEDMLHRPPQEAASLLVEFLSTDLPTSYKGLMEKTYIWIEEKEVATNGTPNDRREDFEIFKRDFSWDNNKGKIIRDRFYLYRGGEHSWPLREVPLEITIGDSSLKRTEEDVFTWTYADMTGILRTIMVEGKSFNMEHKLNEYKYVKPIKQKRRGLDSDRNGAACRELEELTKAGFLRKQEIQMAEEDEDKTAFFIGKEVFCYRKMPFELKNARTTYQMLVDKVFGNQIGRNVKAYVDDIGIKSTSEEDMLQDIQETFNRFRYFQGHSIRVLTEVPIKQMLTSPEKSGSIAKWAIKLGKHDIEFGECGSRKTQIPKDFFIEMPPEESKKLVTRKVDTRKEGSKLKNIRKLYTEGSSSSDGSEAGLMLISIEGKEYTYGICFEFKMTYNEAEYKALLARLRIAQEMEIKSLAIFTAS
nr:reverse transcriptase domain-containing protein [Tanacetum cinerariifolium]